MIERQKDKRQEIYIYKQGTRYQRVRTNNKRTRNKRPEIRNKRQETRDKSQEDKTVRKQEY